jgi:hypothetical protein
MSLYGSQSALTDEFQDLPFALQKFDPVIRSAKIPYGGRTRLNHAKMTRLTDCTTTIKSKIFMPVNQ